MAQLVLAILFSVAFGQIAKFTVAGARGRAVVAAANYLTAALASLVLAVALGRFTLTPEVLLFGGGIGLLFGLTLFAFYASVETAGIAIAGTVMNLSVIIPVVVSIALWGEMPTLAQTFGLGLVLVALALLAPWPRERSAIAPAIVSGQAGEDAALTPGGAGRPRRFLPLLLAMLGQGSISASQKLVHQRGLDEAQLSLMVVLFSVAALVWITRGAAERVEVRPADAGIGVVLGLCNLAVCWSVLVGLSRVPGVVFFPAFSGGALALAALLGWTVWKERASPRAIAAVAVAVVAVVCANSGAA